MPPRRLFPLALLGTITGCSGFDRGPAGLWDELAGPDPAPATAHAHAQATDLAADLATDAAPVPFDPAMVADLPEPARRFLLASIAPGTPLASSVELRMSGSIRLDPEGDPWPMEAEQILAPPHGFIWSARARRGPLWIRGFDRYAHGEGEMRWRLLGLVSVMRATGEDVTRSAAARLAMEAVILPSILVPRGEAAAGPASGEPAAGEGAPRVRWEPVDANRARFLFTLPTGSPEGETIRTTLEVDAEGRPVRAWADRWNEGKYERFQVELSGTFEADGYRLPARVEAGWRLGDPDAFVFFDAHLTSARFR